MVLDASAAVNIATSVIEGESKEEVESFLDNERFVAPRFFNIEASNSVWKYVHAGLYSEDLALELLSSAVGHIDDFCEDEPLVREAYNEAVRNDHPVYDMLYFVLARRKGIGLLTADKKLARLCEENGVECVQVLNL